MASAGKPQDWIKPLDHEGRAEADCYGSHRGTANIWNIPNPQAGMLYAWCRPDQLLARRQQGYHRINTEQDPEFRHPDVTVRKDYGEMLDSVLSIGNLIALRISESQYALIQERKQKAARGARDGVTEAYTDSDEARRVQARYGANAEGPIRFAKRPHGIRREEAQD